MDVALRGVWAERIAERCDKMDRSHTLLARQRVAQLIRSLIVAEQVLKLTPLCPVLINIIYFPE